MGCCGQEDELRFLELTLPWVVTHNGVHSPTSHLPRKLPQEAPSGELWGGRWGDFAFSGFLLSSKTIMVFPETNGGFTPSGAASSSGPVERRLLQSQLIRQ